MTSTDPERWARGKPALLWKRPGLPRDWVRVLERHPEGVQGLPGYVWLDMPGKVRSVRRARAGLAGSAASRDFGSTTSARTLEYALEEIEDSTKEVNEIGSAEDYYLVPLPGVPIERESLQAIRGKLQELRARLEREAAEKDG